MDSIPLVPSPGGSDRPPDRKLRLLLFVTSASSIESRVRAVRFPSAACRSGETSVAATANSNSADPASRAHKNGTFVFMINARRSSCHAAPRAPVEGRTAAVAAIDRRARRRWRGRRRDRGAAARAPQSRNAGAVRTSVATVPLLCISTQRLTGPTTPVHPGPCLTPSL